jgi:hypothetical protein
MFNPFIITAVYVAVVFLSTFEPMDREETKNFALNEGTAFTKNLK